MSSCSQPKKTIRQLRQARDWSQWDLAERLGVRPHTVSRWERGLVVPTAHNQHALAALFDVSVEQIAIGPGEQP